MVLVTYGHHFTEHIETMKIFTWKNVFIIITLSLFICQCLMSFLQYMGGKTDFNEATVDGEDILYPSISVCKKYTFDKQTTEQLINDKTISLEVKKNVAMNKTWSRDRLFYFMSHPTMMNLSFPCTTNDDGTDPGKPCFSFHRKSDR